MVFCTNCGNNCPAGARFCTSCGTPLVSSATADKAAGVLPAHRAASAPRVAAPAARPEETTMTACGPCKPSDVVCPVCKQQAGTLLDKVVGTQHYHLDCFICNQCKKYLGGCKFYRDPREDGMLLCEECKDIICPRGAHARVSHGGVTTVDGEAGSTGYVARQPVISTYGNTKCRRCRKTVYENEKFRACESLWHRQWFVFPSFFFSLLPPFCFVCLSPSHHHLLSVDSFTCEKCGVKLNPQLYESIHNNPYCRECFATIPH